MRLFTSHEKKVIAELCRKSEDIGNDINKEINELFEDLKTDYDENKMVLQEFSELVAELETKLSPQDIEKLRAFSSRLYKTVR